MTRHPTASTLFPYTTLFRSPPRERTATRGRVAPADRHFPPRADPHPPHTTPARSRGSASTRTPTESRARSEEHTSELQSQSNLVCRRLLEKKNHLSVYAQSA